MSKAALSPVKEVTIDPDNPGHNFPDHIIHHDLANDICFCTAVFPFISLNLAGLGVLLYQCLLWLRWGDWSEFFLFEFTESYLSSDFIAWLVIPETWIGLSRISSFVFYEAPLSGSLMVTGFIWVFFSVWLLRMFEL